MPYKDIEKRREADKGYKAKKTAERRAQGLVRKEMWLDPELAKLVKEVIDLCTYKPVFWKKIKEFINQLKDK